MDKILTPDGQSSLTEFGEIFIQTHKRAGAHLNSGPPPERRSTISSMLPTNYSNTRMRNLSGGSSGSTASGSSNGSLNQLDNQFSDKQHTFPLEILLFSGSSPAIPTSARGSSNVPHRKLDRSWSDNETDRNGSHRSVNSSRYKTELCRPFEESGTCKYGDKCQFAHGYNELRNLIRHPKYKTELCRTFHTVGFCPYGPRCHFIHEDETKSSEMSPRLGRAGSIHSSSGSSSPSLSPSGSDSFSLFRQVENTASQVRPSNVDGRQITSLVSNLCSNSFDLQLLERHFSSIQLSSSSNVNDNNIFFNANNNHHMPKLIGTEERDIFSDITVFNTEEALLDNTPTALSSCAAQSARLDNFPFMDKRTPTQWQSCCEDY